MEQPAAEHVTVEIYDQTYHLSGQDPEHVRQLAAQVDAKMRAVASQGRTVDSLRSSESELHDRVSPRRKTNAGRLGGNQRLKV